MRKFLIHAGLWMLLLLSLALPVTADHVPEDNPIGETIVVEPDENIIKEKFDRETATPENRYDPGEPEILDMTAAVYFRRCVKPFLWLFGGGIALFLVSEGVRWLYRKRALQG